jgi:transcription antitermination factor NusG
MFPGYVFVRFNKTIDFWERIYALDGVKLVFSCGPHSPTIIPARIMAIIRDEEQKLPQQARFQSRRKGPAPLIEIGQEVKLLSGPMKGFVGICKMSDNQRVSVLINLLGRSFESEHKLKDVAPATPDA